MLQKDIEKKLLEYINPHLEKDLISTNKVKITLSERCIQLDLYFGFPCQRDHLLIKQQLSMLLGSEFPMHQIEVNFHTEIKSHIAKPGIKKLDQVKNIIAVGSGKGGVGKSTIAINLAIALSKEGAKVGLLDADIYGPSQPSMFGAQGEKPTIDDKKFHPIMRHDIASMSIGYLVEANAPMVWRGPMLGKAIEQLIHDTLWPNLDYLIVDLPPGTGDIQLSLCQKIPINGAIIVTTPQDLALLDVVRSCAMFNKLEIPLLGIVENMAGHVCQNCGHEEKLFGEGGGTKIAQDYAVPLLASVPLNARIRLDTDSGNPLALNENHELSKLFFEAAKMASAKLSLQKIDHASKFPKIIVRYDKPGDDIHEHKV